MLLAAAADLGIDLSRSVLIGDKDSDIRAGIAAGVQALVHVHTGHGSEDHEIAAVAAAQDAFPMCNIESAIDLPAAMDWVKARLNIA
jgi:D-glycero-D-manno-heptose 1,7-bisphosphate phosphatase